MCDQAKSASSPAPFEHNQINKKKIQDKVKQSIAW